jgi:hypothetical protein
MYETQTIAAQALRELLDDSDRDDWDELLAANRALIKAIATGRPMTQNNARIVAEYRNSTDFSPSRREAVPRPWGSMAAEPSTVS